MPNHIRQKEFNLGVMPLFANHYQFHCYSFVCLQHVSAFLSSHHQIESQVEASALQCVKIHKFNIIPSK